MDWIFPTVHGRNQSTELDLIIGGKFAGILNVNGTWLGSSNGIVRHANRCRSEKPFESGRRDHDQVMISNVTAITELVRGYYTGL